jgi:hypothetical protein
MGHASIDAECLTLDSAFFDTYQSRTTEAAARFNASEKRCPWEPAKTIASDNQALRDE